MHGEHLGHAIGNGRPGSEDHTPTSIDGLNMAHLEEHIKRPFTGGLWQTGDARHLGNVEQVFEIVRLIHKQAVNAKFFKRQCVVFLVTGGKGFQFGLQSFLGLFNFLYQPPVF